MKIAALMHRYLAWGLAGHGRQQCLAGRNITRLAAAGRRQGEQGSRGTGRQAQVDQFHFTFQRVTGSVQVRSMKKGGMVLPGFEGHGDGRALPAVAQL